MDLQGYRYWIYGISDSQRVGKLFRFLCVFRFSGNKITQRAQWVEKENRVLLGWYSMMALQALVDRSPALFDSYAAIVALEEVVSKR